MIAKQLLAKITNFNDVAKISGVDSAVIRGWKTRNPRLDLFIAVADAMGYEIIMRKKSAKFRLVTAPKGRIDAFRDNEKIGFVEAETLFAIDKDGYSHEVGPISHRVEIHGKLEAWRTAKSGE